MLRLRPGMEILHVNVCACTCRLHEKKGREVSSSCSWSILGMLLAAKVLRPGHRGTGDISLLRLAEGLNADREKSLNPALKPWQRHCLVSMCKAYACPRGSEIWDSSLAWDHGARRGNGTGALHHVGQWKWSPGPGSPAGKHEAGLFLTLAGGSLASKRVLK